MLEPAKEIEKIGEIVIVSPNESIMTGFLSLLSKDIKTTEHGIIFSNIDVSEDLALFLYGIIVETKPQYFRWDLFANKMLGYIALFDWNDDKSFPRMQNMITFMEDRFNVPVTIAARVDREPENIHTKLYKHCYLLSWKDKFKFYNPNDKSSVKNVILSMIDTLIENYPEP